MKESHSILMNSSSIVKNLNKSWKLMKAIKIFLLDWLNREDFETHSIEVKNLDTESINNIKLHYRTSIEYVNKY
jgi:hypothetical protein